MYVVLLTKKHMRMTMRNKMRKKPITIARCPKSDQPSKKILVNRKLRTSHTGHVASRTQLLFF